jgi:hypothetical protein
MEGEVTAPFGMGRRVYSWMYVGISIKNYSLYQPISWCDCKVITRTKETQYVSYYCAMPNLRQA